MADKPPPDEEQIEAVRESASQLEYAFRARPGPSADGRQSWERRFLATFSRMLQILAVAKFEYLPPFAITCIWENNRRSHAQEPLFNIEHIGDGYDHAHPAYHGQSQLVYQPAFEGRFSTIPEGQLRNVWWSQPPLPQLKVQPIALLDGDNNGNPDQGNGSTQQDEPQAAPEDHAQAEGAEVPGGQVDAEMEMEEDIESQEMHEVEGHAIEEKAADIEGEDRPRAKTGRGGDRSRSRSASRAKKDTLAAAPRCMTRSASHSRPPTSTAAAAASSTGGAAKKPLTANAKGKRKATAKDGTPQGEYALFEVSTPDIGSSVATAKGKGKQVAHGLAGNRVNGGGTLTLKDIMPVDISLKDVPHV